MKIKCRNYKAKKKKKNFPGDQDELKLKNTHRDTHTQKQTTNRCV